MKLCTVSHSRAFPMRRQGGCAGMRRCAEWVTRTHLAEGAAPMSIAGKVAYHAPGGTGLKFVYRDGGGSRRIRELIRRIRAA